MLNTQTVSSPPGRSSLLRSILSLLIINVAIPFGCYTLLKAYHASDVTALGVAAIAPALGALISLLRGRHINIISLFVLGGLVIGILAIFLGGDPMVSDHIARQPVYRLSPESVRVKGPSPASGHHN